MIAQAHGESPDSDSFRKSDCDGKVSGGANSAIDVGGLSGRERRETKKNV